ncbi:MAG: DUF86 domain-containing protein [Chloroflexi bacterium]|nr:DUF86 domain-containing protein [Chloroflexota bacterium]
MLTSNDRVRLEHILDAIGKIAEALTGYSEEQFKRDWQKQLVVERLLEIVGEAAAHLFPEMRDAFPHIPWVRMIGLRNVVTHQYYRVDVQSIWQTAVYAVPPLQTEIQNILHTK